MLNLGEIERKILCANNALTNDLQGEEVLRGLDPNESAFVLSVEQAGASTTSADEGEEYRQLRQRHLESRQMHNAHTREKITKKPELGA